MQISYFQDNVFSKGITTDVFLREFLIHMGLDDHVTTSFRMNFKLVISYILGCFRYIVYVYFLKTKVELRESSCTRNASDSDSGTSVTLAPYDRKHVESSMMEPKAKKKKPDPGKGQHVMTTFFKSTQAVNSGLYMKCKEEPLRQ